MLTQGVAVVDGTVKAGMSLTTMILGGVGIGAAGAGAGFAVGHHMGKKSGVKELCERYGLQPLPEQKKEAKPDAESGIFDKMCSMFGKKEDDEKFKKDLDTRLGGIESFIAQFKSK